jgi:TDG/mug DNA glycosylase family protein
MTTAESFEPVMGVNPQVLILGSMPGVASLQAQQYYAHPRNALWPILGALFEIEWASDYASRIEQFRTLPLGLWDVLRSCTRPGSLDASIVRRSEQANAIGALLSQQASIRLIAFNGQAAQQLFRRHVAKTLTHAHQPDLVCLPSTSPAHAARTFEQKLEAWREILDYLN